MTCGWFSCLFLSGTVITGVCHHTLPWISLKSSARVTPDDLTPYTTEKNGIPAAILSIHLSPFKSYSAVTLSPQDKPSRFFYASFNSSCTNIWTHVHLFGTKLVMYSLSLSRLQSIFSTTHLLHVLPKLRVHNYFKCISGYWRTHD